MGFRNFALNCFKLRTFIQSSTANSRHCLPSAVLSLDDDQATQNNSRLNTAICEAALTASGIQISEAESKPDTSYFNIFPGEHYRLLAGLLRNLEPKRCIDIGTYTGMSARVMLDHTCDSCEIHSFDIIPWQDFDSHLNEKDFEQRHLTQHLEDLSQKDIFEKHISTIENSQIIFCDAPKDGQFEYGFLRLLQQVKPSEKQRLLILDDIRFLNMLPVWRSIRSPKIDATSFGHWSGTGIVDITSGFELDLELLGGL